MGYSAADVERFTYCPLSWSLAKKGTPEHGEAIEQGEVAHDAVGKRVKFWRRMVDEHYEALRVALYMALTAASAATLALEVVFLDFDGPFHWILILMSLCWLIVSLAFLLRAMWKEEEAKKFAVRSGLVEGELAYSDLDRPGETLRSMKYELAGKPDYIVRRKGSYIPVELKTGRTPDQPHDSHLMQLGVYCVLVEETYGTRPSHGVLQYPERAFEVSFSEEFRDKVLETTLRMRMAELTGNVHRDHDRPGKCRGCSRREACPERLV